MVDAEPLQSLAVGSVVADTYQVTRLLGRGGMGSVWEASHLRLPGKRVAIKVLHADVAADQEALTRFRREAEIATRLGHPNIVEVHDFNTLAGGQPYLVLELLVGESLDARIRRGLIPTDQVLRIAGQIAAALVAAHRAGVVHRDLKPQNVFLVPREDEAGGELVKVLDFGISKIRGSQTVKTQDSTILGTPQYMAPEQAIGNHAAVDPRTDVFALGAMVYEMLAGRPAFSGQNIPEVVFKVVYEPPPPLAQLAPALSPRLVQAVERALAKKQDERFPDVTSFIEQLAGVSISTLRRQPVLASPEPAAADPLAATIDSGRRERESIAPPPDHTFKTRPSPRRGLWLSLVLVAAAALVAGVMVQAQRSDPAPVAASGPAEDGPAVAAEHQPAEAAEDEPAAVAEDAPAEAAEDEQAPATAASTADPAPPSARPEPRAKAPAPPSAAAKPPAPSPSASKGRPPIAPVRSLRPADTPVEPQAAGDDPRADLRAAEAALQRGDYRDALHRSERASLSGGGAAAFSALARSYCGIDDVGNAAAALRRIPRRKVVLRRAVRAFCSGRGHELDE